MNKRKILLLASALCIVAILAVGSTLAYFTDTDKATNVFTVGNIDIELIEGFDEEGAKDIVPGLNVTKFVDVQNVGTNDAYVRVHVAIPAILDSGREDQPQFAAYNNTLHWNFSGESVAKGYWNWNVDPEGPNYPGNGGTWNSYPATVDGVDYNVYVATYETALKHNETTEQPAITNVYLDVNLTQPQWEDITAVIGEQIKVLVLVEGVQTVTFEEGGAYEALNTAFGVPGEYTPDW